MCLLFWGSCLEPPYLDTFYIVIFPEWESSSSSSILTPGIHGIGRLGLYNRGGSHDGVAAVTNINKTYIDISKPWLWDIFRNTHQVPNEWHITWQSHDRGGNNKSEHGNFGRIFELWTLLMKFYLDKMSNLAWPYMGILYRYFGWPESSCYFQTLS